MNIDERSALPGTGKTMLHFVTISRYGRAIELCDAALEAQPALDLEPELNVRRIRMACRIALGELPKAHDECAEILVQLSQRAPRGTSELVPMFIEVLATRTELGLRLDVLDDALDDADRLVALWDHPGGHDLRAEILSGLDRADEAEQAIARGEAARQRMAERLARMDRDGPEDMRGIFRVAQRDEGRVPRWPLVAGKVLAPPGERALLDDF